MTPVRPPKGLREIVIKLDHSDNDAITPEATVEVLQPAIALLQNLPEQDRQALTELISQFVHQETNPERQPTVWETPETLRLPD
ncbi:hypothetical protein ACFY3V_10285 [Streptosporangium sp. NPDC000095]|uniref:hypothetical protein n=1 Tax=Streptosporangium sp. NPDC000095 TaxID=3366184 RepID=UPI0036BD3F75